MGTGIVSVGLSIDGHEVVSRVLLALAAAVWLVLAAAVAALALRDRPLLRLYARAPAALTGVAGTDVLGARLTLLGWQREAAALLAIGTVLWVVLLPYVFAHRLRPAVGASFMLTVSTESIAVLASRLAVAEHARWLAVAAVAFLALGVLLYGVVLAGFELRHLRVGRGDHWVSGGALAIAALACARCAEAAGGVGPHALAGPLDTATLALWIAAASWLPLLIAAELLSRRLGYDLQRWATVFPLGMYAVCSFADGSVRRLPALESFARVWIWVAFATWLVVAAGLARRAAAATSTS